LEDETFAAWRRFLEGIARTGPLVLIVEDLHWADEAFVRFLVHLAGTSTGLPMMLVVTARPEIEERGLTLVGIAVANLLDDGAVRCSSVGRHPWKRRPSSQACSTALPARSRPSSDDCSGPTRRSPPSSTHRRSRRTSMPC
jgi:hypothetical protein